MRILCIGDSNTWGYVPGEDGVRTDKRWTKLLAELRTNDTVIEGCGIGRINVTEESTGIRLINVTLIEVLFAQCRNISIIKSGFKEEGIRFVDVQSFLANNCNFLSNGAIKNCKNVVLVNCRIKTELDDANTFIAVDSKSDKEGLCTFSEEWNKVIVENNGYD